MSVKPEIADLLFLLTEIGSDSSGCACGNGMIPAENERKKALAQGFFNGFGDILAGLGNFLKILRALFPDGHFFGLLHFEVADVFDRVAKLLDGGLQTRAAQGGWAHVHTAAALAEVHGN